MSEDWDINIDFDAAVSAWASQVAPNWQEAVRTTIPQKSGATAGTIEAQATGDGVEVEGDGIAGMLVTGTSSHAIDAHGPYSLHSAETGEYFGPHVNHPGTAADDYLDRAIEMEGDHSADVLGDFISTQWSGL